MSLIKEINDLRRELKLARTQIHDLEASLGMHSKKNKKKEVDPAALTYRPPDSILERELEEKKKVIEMQQVEMRRLRNEIQELEYGSRPPSQGRLPPVPPAVQSTA